MAKLLKTPKLYPPKKLIIKKNTTIKEVGGRWYIDKMNINTPTIKEGYWTKKRKQKKTKSRKIYGSQIIIGTIGGSNCIGKILNG